MIMEGIVVVVPEEQPKPMKLWLYVICEMLGAQDDSIPSFRSAFIKAENEEDAYTIAHNRVQQPRGNGINDCVFEVGAAPDGVEVIDVPIAVVQEEVRIRVEPLMAEIEARMRDARPAITKAMDEPRPLTKLLEEAKSDGYF